MSLFPRNEVDRVGSLLHVLSVGVIVQASR